MSAPEIQIAFVDDHYEASTYVGDDLVRVRARSQWAATVGLRAIIANHLEGIDPPAAREFKAES